MVQSGTFWAALVIGVTVFWVLPKRFRMAFLAAWSAALLLQRAPISVATLGAWLILFHTVARMAAKSPARHRWALPALIVAALGCLAYFKYLPPLVEALAGNWVEMKVVIPLGISYFTFKLIHYALEVARGTIRDHSLADFACYIFLLPIFIAGPIERFDHFLANREHNFSHTLLVEGATRIIHGLIKRCVLADLILGTVYSMDDIATLAANPAAVAPATVWRYVILTYAYAYLDFSAYSDIAIGASRMFGLRIMENFNWPIAANNIGDFWKRWHMTLAGWCQAYVYLPVMGLTRNPYAAVYATFLVMGFWHAGSLNWLCWGLTHATAVSAFLTWERFKRKRKWRARPGPLRRTLGTLITGFVVSSAFIFPMLHGVAGPFTGIKLLVRMWGLTLGG